MAERDPILEALVTRSGAMVGAEAFVRLLRARGVPMAVATSSDRALYEIKVRGYHLTLRKSEAAHVLVESIDPVP